VSCLTCDDLSDLKGDVQQFDRFRLLTTSKHYIIFISNLWEFSGITTVFVAYGCADSNIFWVVCPVAKPGMPALAE
jgi:hypothetical protein